jgi:N-acetylmuramoyl-L-alanine amidase
MADNVFINGRAAVHSGSAGKSIAFPDVCLCPPPPPSGPIPTPLPNTAQSMDLQGGATTVTIEGKPVGHAKSFIAKSTGNEVATSTGGGVITHMVQGMAYFQTFSMDVFIESQPAVRHMDLVTHNHMAMMPGNTPPAPWMSTMMAGPGVAPKETRKDEKSKGKGKDFLKLQIQDEDGVPLPYVQISLKHSQGTLSSRTLTAGKVEIRQLPKGTVEVTLPGYDAEGWSKATAGAPVGKKTTYKVRQGDTIARIAWIKGFADWQSIYSHSDNAALRKKRPNPDILAPGDELVIPERKPPVFQLATGKEHTLKVKAPKVQLHLALVDEEGKPLKSAKYEILLSGGPKTTIKGTTDGNGILKEKIPYDEVEIEISAWPPDDPNKQSVNWRVYVGGLDPIETPTGVQARLRGLGFDCGDELGEIGPATADAIDAFKELHKIDEDEELGPTTLKKLEAEYGR